MDQPRLAYDADGRLHVSGAPISQASVTPYDGKEIPGFKALGLDPHRVYRLLKSPKELSKAACSFDHLPVLNGHSVSSEIDPELVVGSLGADCRFEAPFLKNSLVIWNRSAIARVAAGTKRELSISYGWRPDMTSGSYQGVSFDGVMRDIVGHHVALVPRGRAGPLVAIQGQTPRSTPASSKIRPASRPVIHIKPFYERWPDLPRIVQI